MRSSAVPAGTSTVLAAWGWLLLSVPVLPKTAVPVPPIWGPVPQEVAARSAPPSDWIQARSLNTSSSKALSTGSQFGLVPLEVTPATTVCPPSDRKSGPPESPKQVSEFEPGAPRGSLKFQHTKPAAGGSQAGTVAAPRRLMPSSVEVVWVLPKPTISPVRPSGGWDTRLSGLGAMLVTGAARWRIATSDTPL